jgi:hypothetical protein
MSVASTWLRLGVFESISAAMCPNADRFNGQDTGVVVLFECFTPFRRMTSGGRSVSSDSSCAWEPKGQDSTRQTMLVAGTWLQVEGFHMMSTAMYPNAEGSMARMHVRSSGWIVSPRSKG